MNPHAQQLGRLARGRPKALSAEERQRRRQTMQANRDKITKARWPKKPEEQKP